MQEMQRIRLAPFLTSKSTHPARVPAGDIDAKVVDQVRKVLQAPEVIAQAVQEVQKLTPEADEKQTIQTLQSIEADWDELFPAEQSKIAHLLVHKVTVSPTTGLQDS